jgi:hypothetical protein
MVLQLIRGGARGLLPTAAAALLVVAACFTVAERPAFASDGPFAGLSGSWSGAGSVALPNGAHERIRCRATYVVGSSGSSLQQSLRCASDSYRFELRSNVNSDGNSITGSWSESSRNLNGSISGRVRGNQINALVEANGFSATIIIVTKGGRQSVSIRSLSHELAGATISLSRS